MADEKLKKDTAEKIEQEMMSVIMELQTESASFNEY